MELILYAGTWLLNFELKLLSFQDLTSSLILDINLIYKINIFFSFVSAIMCKNGHVQAYL